MTSRNRVQQGRRQQRIRDLSAGSGAVLLLALSLSVVAAACLPSTQTKGLGLPTSRKTVSSTIVTTTTTPPTTTPPTTVVPTTSTTVPVPSVELPTDPPAEPPAEPPADVVTESVSTAGYDACAALRTAAPGSTVVVPSGSWSIGDCRIDGRGRAAVTVRSESGSTTDQPSTLVGALRCADCDGWRFDGIAVRGAGTLVDPAYVVSMARGDGWRWTNCDLSNGVDATGRRLGVRGVFNVWEAARNWQVDSCRIHSNGSSRPGVSSNNWDHLVYINGFQSTTSANAQIGPNNVFENNRWGAPVKVGFGVSSTNAPVGVRGVRVTGNTLRSNSSPDGNCGVLVAGDSADTVVSGNRIDCSDQPEESTLSAVAIRDWPAGTTIRVEGNTLVGSRGAGTSTACGSPVNGQAYDRSITVRQWLTGWWFTVTAGSCGWQGISSVGNVTVGA